MTIKKILKFAKRNGIRCLNVLGWGYRWIERVLFDIYPGIRRCKSVDLTGTALVTVVNDKFIDYCEVFFHSLKKRNPWLDCPLIVVWSKKLSPLNRESRCRIEAVWSDVRYHEVDESKYRVFLKHTPEYMLPALFSLECFNMQGWDKVVFFDVDMFCLGDVSALFRMDVSLAVCPSGNDRQRKQRLAGGYHIRFGLNSGVMVIGKKYRKGDVYRQLFGKPSGHLADQDILENYFKWRPVYCLDHIFNYHAEFFWDEYGSQDDVRILHYAGVKPLDQPELPRMKVWNEYVSRYAICS
ncbi:MAG: hypothetical protein EOL87_16005 [Spartobacteria bacterium]|nr:hypothetical protein [Spartobacteria bacterium]